FRAVRHQGTASAKARPEDRESGRLVALGRGHEDGAVAGRSNSVVRVEVAVAEKQTEVVGRRVARDVAGERGPRRPFLVEPREFVTDRVLAFEHALRAAAEPLRIS